MQILEQSAPRHPTSAQINKGVRETIAKYGKSGISFRDFVRCIKRYLDHTATLFNDEVSSKGSVVEVLNSSSVSSPEIFESNSPGSEQHHDMQPEETIHHDTTFIDDDANAFLEQIMSSGSGMLEAVNPFIFNIDAEPEFSGL